MEKVLGILDLHTDKDLGIMTEKRAIASTSFLGRYAFMDFPLSNFTNSGIDEIGILARDHLRSLIRHLGFGHAFNDNTKLGSVTIMYDEPYAHNLGYNHDINNLKENRWVLDKTNATTVVIAPASIINRIDFRPYIEEHHRRDSRITMLFHPLANAKSHFIDRDILGIDSTNRVNYLTTNRGTNDEATISLSTYIIDIDMLKSLIQYASSTSAFFNLRDTLAYIAKDIKILALPFEGYVTCFDSLSSYLSQSLDLLNPAIRNQLFSTDWPIFTKTYDTPPATFGASARVGNCFIANGAHIEGTVKNSIIGRDVVIKPGSLVENTIICSGTIVGENATLNHVVSDKEAQILFTKNLLGTVSDPFHVKREDIV